MSSKRSDEGWPASDGCLLTRVQRLSWVGANRIRARRRRVLLALVLASVLVFGWIRDGHLAQERRRYDGRSAREWVDLALAEHPLSLDGRSARMVRQIGPAAVPHLIARLRRLQDGPLRERLLVWQNEHLPTFCRWLEERPNCDGAILDIVRLLSELGPAARPAVPAMIRACGEVHYGVYREFLDCFAGMGPAASEAVPWLRRMANEGGEEDFHAAWALWMVATNDTTFPRMIVRAIQVQRKPSLADDEISLARDDAGLNRRLVPLLAGLLGDITVPEEERGSAARHLGERGSDARSALPLMRAAAAQTESAELREEMTDAIEAILDPRKTEPAGAGRGAR